MTRPRYNAPPADYSVLKVTTGSGWLTAKLHNLIQGLRSGCWGAQATVNWSKQRDSPIRKMNENKSKFVRQQARLREQVERSRRSARHHDARELSNSNEKRLIPVLQRLTRLIEGSP